MARTGHTAPSLALLPARALAACGDGCVAPTPVTIADGSHPVSRQVFIDVNARQAAQSRLLTEFVDFYLHHTIDAVPEVGDVSLSDADLAETRARWAARITGAA